MLLNKILDFNLKCLGTLWINVEGISMEPILKSGYKIEISKLETYNIGDIIVFKNKDVLIVHRIIEIGPKYILTKGDNSSYSDLPITKEDIIGKVFNIDKLNKKYKIEHFGKYNKFAELISSYENKKTVKHKQAYYNGKQKTYLFDKVRHSIVQLLLTIVLFKEMWRK